LSKHDVTRYKLAGRQETPSHFGSACFVDLVNVRHYPISRAVVYPISFPAVAPDNFEVVFVIKLGSLIRGEPISQQPPAASFPGILAMKAPVQLTYRLFTRNGCLRRRSANEKHASTANEAREK
jgi:hypothetical protein